MAERTSPHLTGGTERPAYIEALARSIAAQPLVGPGELEQILIRLDQIGDTLRAIEVNTRGLRRLGKPSAA